MTAAPRWFASNAPTRLVVPGRSTRGSEIATEGDSLAAAVVCLSARLVEPVWRYAQRHAAAVERFAAALPSLLRA